jgi:hypothetical protein
MIAYGIAAIAHSLRKSAKFFGPYGLSDPNYAGYKCGQNPEMEQKIAPITHIQLKNRQLTGLNIALSKTR